MVSGEEAVVCVIHYEGEEDMFAPLRCCFERDKFFLNLLRHVVHRVHGGLPDDYVKYLCRHDRVENVVAVIIITLK